MPRYATALVWWWRFIAFTLIVIRVFGPQLAMVNNLLQTAQAKSMALQSLINKHVAQLDAGPGSRPLPPPQPAPAASLQQQQQGYGAAFSGYPASAPPANAPYPSHQPSHQHHPQQQPQQPQQQPQAWSSFVPGGSAGFGPSPFGAHGGSQSVFVGPSAYAQQSNHNPSNIPNPNLAAFHAHLGSAPGPASATAPTSGWSAFIGTDAGGSGFGSASLAKPATAGSAPGPASLWSDVGSGPSGLGSVGLGSGGGGNGGWGVPGPSTSSALFSGMSALAIDDDIGLGRSGLHGANGNQHALLGGHGGLGGAAHQHHGHGNSMMSEDVAASARLMDLLRDINGGEALAGGGPVVHGTSGPSAGVGVGAGAVPLPAPHTNASGWGLFGGSNAFGSAFAR